MIFSQTKQTLTPIKANQLFWYSCENEENIWLFFCLFFFVHISQDHTWNYWAKFSQYIRQHLNICNIWKIKWSELPRHKTSQKLNLWGFFCSKCLVTQLKYCYLFQNILLKTSFSWTIWPTLLYLKVTNKYKFWPRVIT